MRVNGNIYDQVEELPREQVLRVGMFGNFSMVWQGRPLTDEKLKETHFTSLMQLLLHHRESGVSRDQLEEVLFGDRDVEDRHHLLQSVIYNAKKKLKKMGLPVVKYIILKKGIFYWNSEEIPVIEDAAEFDRIYQMAVESGDEDEQLVLYSEACHLYKGEFLSTYAGVLWAAAEARKYRIRFCECVERAAEIMRRQQNYLQMEEIGRYASAISPFSDWEVITMEAMVSMGRYEEARSFYAATSDLYLRKRGIRPSSKLMETMEKLGNSMVHAYEVLDTIQDNLSEEPENGGGYLCTYPVFQGIYQMLNRIMERGGQSVYLMLCTLIDGKGNPITDEDRLEELSNRLGDAICHFVRHGDAVNRYGNGQYLILLVNITREDCEIVQKRIDQNFVKGRQRSGVEYFVNSVICNA